MRRFITIAIPSVLLALFIFTMLSGSLVKKSLGKEEDIALLIEGLTNDMNNEAWDKVGQGIDKLENVWKKAAFMLQFSSERDEINNFYTCIARLRGAVQAKDKADTFMELYEAYDHWKRMGE